MRKQLQKMMGKGVFCTNWPKQVKKKINILKY